MKSECSIYLKNRIGSHVEVIGTYKLILKSGFVLDLERTFYVLSFSRNLIFVRDFYLMVLVLTLLVLHFI